MNSCVEDEYRNGVELHLSKVRFMDEICMAKESQARRSFASTISSSKLT